MISRRGFITVGYKRDLEMKHENIHSLTNNPSFHVTTRASFVSVCGVKGSLIHCINPAGTISPFLQLVGHTEHVTCSSFLNNNTLLTSSFDSTIRLWNIKESNEGVLDQTSRGNINTIVPTITKNYHSSNINSCIAIDAISSCISGGNDERLMVWNLGKDLYYPFSAQSQGLGYISSLDFGGSNNIICGILGAGKLGENVILYDIRTKRKVFTFRKHTSGAMDVSLHPFCPVILSCGGEDRSVFCYDMRNMKVLYHNSFHCRTNAVDFHCSGRYFGVGQSNLGDEHGCVSIVDLKLRKKRTFNTSSRVNCCNFSGSSRMSMFVSKMDGAFLFKSKKPYEGENVLYNPLTDKFDFSFVGENVFLFYIQTDFVHSEREQYLRVRQEELKRHVTEISLFTGFRHRSTVLVLNPSAVPMAFELSNVYLGFPSKKIEGSIICVFGGLHVKTNVFSYRHLREMLTSYGKNEKVVFVVNKFQIRGSSFFKAFFSHLKRNLRVAYETEQLKELMKCK